MTGIARMLALAAVMGGAAWGQWASGSGGSISYTGGAVGVGTSTPGTELDVAGYARVSLGMSIYANPNFGTNGLGVGAGPKNQPPGGGGVGTIGIFSNDPSTSQLQGWMSLVTDATATNHRLAIEAIEQGTAWRSVTLAEQGGNVGIGTANPNASYLLDVNGAIGAKDIYVTTNALPDYVFDADYRNAPLSEVAAYIDRNHHLPGMPSAAEAERDRLSVGDMQNKLLQKVEELTLHMIDADERNQRLEEQNRELREQMAQLRAQVQTIAATGK